MSFFSTTKRLVQNLLVSSILISESSIYTRFNMSELSGKLGRFTLTKISIAKSQIIASYAALVNRIGET